MRKNLYNLSSIVFIPLLTCILTGAAATADCQEPSVGSNAMSLFDGQSLTGWEGDERYWRVEQGAIVGEIPKGESLNKNTWLVWKGGELSDFDLRLQCKLTGLPAANSGIQFRCQVDSVDHVSGYQADFDMGATWLGRIYDEHGRALLVERGTRVKISEDGKRTTEKFAPAEQYEVLFREDVWNDYRIVAVGPHVAVYVNGTLFSELYDTERGEQDLTGKLAFQLHSGPEARVEFQNVTLEVLPPDSNRLNPFKIAPQETPDATELGSVPQDSEGRDLNFGFESGDLSDWNATGDAFKSQPMKNDGISQRWPGQTSNKQGEFFFGGYEIVGDQGTGTLTSSFFKVTKPYASFLIGGGSDRATRVDLISLVDGKQQVFSSTSGENREQMRRVAVDLREHVGNEIAVKLIDESKGAWGHLNFDDFRLHDVPPANIETNAQSSSQWRTTFNPLLHHLIPNAAAESDRSNAASTTAQMYVPEGFSAETIAAEPDIHQPMAFTFDAKGRLWVVEGHCYPQKRPAGEGIDRILIFSDQDHDGSYESVKTFCEGLNLVSGLEVGHGGVWVGAAPELLFIPDRDGDDQPDGPPQVLLDGFGYADTHETLNSFMWGPDGWLYGNQGVFNVANIGPPADNQRANALESKRTELKAGVWRYHPTKHKFEVFAHGGSNQWGLDYDQHGQIFMTHCRSYWGRGSATHVIQGGHYWNQVNSGYAPFVSAESLPNKPWMVNYMLASARYGHGEGGAGKRGSRAVYGGHSHVGTMIYLGDNWPAEYRNNLFSHNLHGHQINQQKNVRDAGGYNTLHSGADVFFCSDPQYIGVDLQYGPDGAVYVSDWYDPRHCHNPNSEQWDRGNGRMYRIKFDATWQPAKVDHGQESDLKLVETLGHKNQWHARMARLILADRAQQRELDANALKMLRNMLAESADENLQLQALWALHVTGNLNDPLLKIAISSPSEYVRGWAIQLATESLENDPNLESNSEVRAQAQSLLTLAEQDESLFVRRYLASAIQRIPAADGWRIAENLCGDMKNATDRELPLLIWYGLAPLVLADVDRGFELAEKSKIPAISDYIYWYAARNLPAGRERLIERLANSPGSTGDDLLSLLTLAVGNLRNGPMPQAWTRISQHLYKTVDNGRKDAVLAIGVAFADELAFAQIREDLETAISENKTLGSEQDKKWLRMLASDQSEENLSLYIRLLDHETLAADVIPMLSSYNQQRVPEELLRRLPKWNEKSRAAAIEVLCSRASWANRLLDEIASGRVQKSELSAYYARQMYAIGDDDLNVRLEREWGRLKQSSAEMQQEIKRTIEEYTSAPLWAYSQAAGAVHYKNLCAQCHGADGMQEAVAPRLAGSGTKGIEYLVENVIDPNAVIGEDFQARVVLTIEGQVITGLIEKDSESSITIRTLGDTMIVGKDQIDRIQKSPNSFMPQGLIDSLNSRERIELFLHLMRM